MEPADDIDPIRCSSLTGWPDCPRRAAATMFARLLRAMGFTFRILVQGIGASVGTGGHKGAAVMLTEKAKTGILAPLSVATDAAIEAYRECNIDGVMYDQTTATPNEAERQVRQLVAVYHAEVAPPIQPILVEEKLEADVPYTVNHLVLSGHADLVAREPGSIDDLKTGARLSTHAPQIGGYAELAQANAICEVDRARIVFLKRGKTAPAPVYQEYSLAQSTTAARRILASIDSSLTTFLKGDAVRRIRPGDPWSFQANPSSNLCSSKWCPCYGVKGETSFCHEWVPKENGE